MKKQITLLAITLYIITLAIPAFAETSHEQPHTFDMFLAFTDCDAFGDNFKEKCDYKRSNYPMMFNPRFAVSFYNDPKIVNKNHVMHDGEQICDSDKVVLEDTDITGEWFQKGGPADSPPVQFVTCDELKQIMSSVVDYHKKYSISDQKQNLMEYIPPAMLPRTEPLGRSDILVYRSSLGSMAIYEAVICCADKETTDTLNSNTNPSIEMKVSFNCIMYGDRYALTSMEGINEPTLNRLAYYYFSLPTDENVGYSTSIKQELINQVKASDPNWLNTLFDLARMKDMTIKKEVSPISSTISGGPQLSIAEYTYPENIMENEPLNIKIKIVNTGYMPVILDSIYLNTENTKTIFLPENIPVGESEEIIIQATLKETQDLFATIKYHTTDIGCEDTKNFAKTFVLKEVKVEPLHWCKQTTECPPTTTGAPTRCCRGICRDLSKGACDDFNGDGHFEWSYY